MEKMPTDIQALIENHVNAFNTQNRDLFLSVFGDTAIIIDGIAPYRWLNPNAPTKWLDDVEKWRADLGVTHEHLSHETGFWNVEGSHAEVGDGARLSGRWRRWGQALITG